MHRAPLQLKLGLACAALSVGALVIAARVSSRLFERHVEAASLANLQDAAQAFAAQERGEIEKLATTLDALLRNDELRAAFTARDRAKLLALSRPLLETMRERDRITHWYFIAPEPEQTVFLRVHRPELNGDRVDRVTLLRAIETKELGAGKELGKTAFALRVVRPWFHDGKIIGYVELAEEIDHFLTAMKARTGDDYGLVVKKRYLDETRWAQVLGPRANSWNDRPDVVVVDTTTFTDGIADLEADLETVPESGLALGEVERGDRALVRGIFPVRDAGGRKVGGLFVQHDFTATHAALAAAKLESFFALLAIGAILAAAVAGAAHRFVFRRLAAVRRELEARVAAERRPPAGREEITDDDLSRIAALVTRVVPPTPETTPAPAPPPARAGGDDPA
jgi:hypothetical protein